MSILKDLIAVTGNTYIKIAEQAQKIGGYIDTGSLMLNAQISGSIYGGIPRNRITGVAGEKGTGKTFMMLKIVKNFLKRYKNGIVIIFDTEWSLNREVLSQWGIPDDRCDLLFENEIQRIKFQIYNMIDKYNESGKTKYPLLICIDSLGMLASSQEKANVIDNKDVTDMARAKELKALFRILTLDLGASGIDLFFTNHTYETIGLFSKKVMGGGSGGEYAPSTLLFLSKRADVEEDIKPESDDDDEKEGFDKIIAKGKKEKEARKPKKVTGALITCTTEKCRSAREKSQVGLRISFTRGLDLFYGVLDFALEQGIIRKDGRQILWIDGEKYYHKEIKLNPKKFYNKKFLDLVDVAAQKFFRYQSENKNTDVDTLDELMSVDKYTESKTQKKDSDALLKKKCLDEQTIDVSNNDNPVLEVMEHLMQSDPKKFYNKEFLDLAELIHPNEPPEEIEE